MDPITAKLMSAAGAAADPVYVDDVFSTYLYDGNGTSQTINNGIDVSGEGGLVWIKNREANASDHIFTDTERGTNTVLESNRGRAAQAKTDMITSFNSNGFAVADNGHVNENGDNICSWTFRKAPGFFDIITYTGNGNGSGRTLSHSLGSAPGSIWIKVTTGADEDWICYHRSVGTAGHVRINKTISYLTNQMFANVTATSFDLIDADAGTNANNETYVAYIFAHDDQSFGDAGNESIIKCGSYTCDSSGGVAPIDLGWEPQWLLVKKTSGTKDWVLVDNMRRWTADGKALWLQPNDNSAENSADTLVKLNSTGFQPHNSSLVQDPNDTFIYIAIRRAHKPPSAGTEVFKPELLASLTQTSTPGFAPDLVWQDPNRSGSYSFFVGSRLTGNGKYLQTSATSAEGSFTSWEFDAPTGKFTQSLTTGSTSGGIQHFFKRAPGFFDVVTYAGNSTSGRAVPHNLGVVPELMIIKSRDGSRAWRVYDANTGASGSLRLNSDAAKDSNSAYWSTPTADNIILGTDNDTNSSSYDYIAYLFATLPGISKVGSYAGNGGSQNIDCGFTNSARFVLIKRTDSADNWYVFDTARGINSGNDPYLRLDVDSAEVTIYDRVNPLSSGFNLPNDNGAVNDINGTYLFLAIA